MGFRTRANRIRETVKIITTYVDQLLKALILKVNKKKRMLILVSSFFYIQSLGFLNTETKYASSLPSSGT